MDKIVDMPTPEKPDSESEEPTVNPCPPEGLNEEERALLRGDTIGDTAYTDRWVLKCLRTITEALPSYLLTENDTTEDEEPPVMELDETVEYSACQLWDMTAEKDVVHHLLKMKEINIFQLVELVIRQSKSPRLTELMIGIVGNIACIEEGCIAVLEEHETFLYSVFDLFGRSSDVPSMTESFRFLHQLLWHRVNRTDSSTLASCRLIKILCQEPAKDIISFILANCLSDTLLTGLLKLLSELLFISLPKTEVSVALYFSDQDIVASLLDIFKRKLGPLSDDDLDHIDPLSYKALNCLYAFTDTPGAQIFEKQAAKDPTTEKLLLKCIEYDSGHFDPETATEELCYQLTCLIGLCHMIIPVMKNKHFLMTVGHLLSLVNGQTLQYGVKRSRSKDSAPAGSPAPADKVISTLCDRGSQDLAPPKPLKDDDSSSHNISYGWLSPSPQRPTSTDSPFANPEKPTGAKPTEESSTVCNTDNLRESLEVYCYHVFNRLWGTPNKSKKKGWTREQKDTLAALDECHAHEVVYILDSVRKRNPLIVPRLQEEILDSGLHSRLVKVLAHLYE